MFSLIAALWIAFRNRGDLEILVQGDRQLFNQYEVSISEPPQREEILGQEFIDWLVSPEGQQAIANYKINGVRLLLSNATDPNA